MNPKDMTAEEIAEWEAERKAIHELAKQGKLIDAGFEDIRMSGFPMAGPNQVKALRTAFFAGAKHLQRAMLCGVALGMEEDPADEDMMQSIDDELERFIENYVAAIPTAGNA